MSAIPETAVPAVLRGLSQYVRGTTAAELPPALGPVKRSAQTPKGITRHKATLIEALEDDAFRAQVGQWLSRNKKLPLTKADLEVLRLVVDRPEGWTETLARKAPAAKVKTREAAAPDATQRIEREKEATRKAKEEARKAREERDAAIAEQKRVAQSLAAELGAARKEIGELEGKVRDLQRSADKARNDLERDARKARSALDKANAQIDELKRRLKEEKARLRPAPRAERSSAVKTMTKEGPKAPRGPRKPLKAPKGRLDTEPETLAGWLARDDVHLIVDGYNLTRNEASYGHLSLEAQRERLLDLLKRFVTQRKVDATLVWDGGDVPPSSQRRRHGRLKVEFSPPGDEKDRADLHIVSLVKALPPIPVVVATNDRGLQKAVRDEGATVVKAEQLLALLR